MPLQLSTLLLTSNLKRRRSRKPKWHLLVNRWPQALTHSIWTTILHHLRLTCTNLELRCVKTTSFMANANMEMSAHLLIRRHRWWSRPTSQSCTRPSSARSSAPMATAHMVWDASSSMSSLRSRYSSPVLSMWSNLPLFNLTRSRLTILSLVPLRLSPLLKRRWIWSHKKQSQSRQLPQRWNLNWLSTPLLWNRFRLSTLLQFL